MATSTPSNWLQMTDIRQYHYADAVWVPLAANATVIEEGAFGYSGYRQQLLHVESRMMPLSYKGRVLPFRGCAEGPLQETCPSVRGKQYKEAQVTYDMWSGLRAIHPVLKQHFDTGDKPVWYLNQDILLALHLKRDDDSWVCPAEDYVEVARLHRNNEGDPQCLEIRTEHLRDYLKARNRGLLIKSFHSRRRIGEIADSSLPPREVVREEFRHGMMETYAKSIHQRGDPFTPCTGMRVSRTDVDPEEDVPVLDRAKDGNVAVESWTATGSGRRLLLATGDLWMHQWIDPGPTSPRILGEHPPATIPFIVDNVGTRMFAPDLVGQLRWLWFKPSLVPALLALPGGTLGWFSQDTGCVGGARNRTVHFGMNRIGLINVYAKDIGKLPESHQKRWAAHNVGPEGKVCEELLAAQMQCRPPHSIAPEKLLQNGVDLLDQAVRKRVGRALLKRHADEDRIAEQLHRFRAVDADGFYALAKDMARYLVERFDVKVLRELSECKDPEVKSLKLLSKAVDLSGADGDEIVAPLFGANDLRHADAHLPSRDTDDALKAVGVSDTSNWVLAGKAMIQRVADALYQIANCLAPHAARDS